MACGSSFWRGGQIAISNEKLKQVLSDRAEGEPHQGLTQKYFVFKNEADIEPLLSGLGKAGAPNCRQMSIWIRRTD
jgi:adenylate cyclase